MRWTKDKIDHLRSMLMSRKVKLKDLAKDLNIHPDNLRKAVERAGLQDAAQFSRSIGTESSLNTIECTDCGKYCRKKTMHYLRSGYQCSKCFPLTKLYYLPEEHYIGITNNLKKRMKGHRDSGKITEGHSLIAYFEKRVDAHYVETLFHMRGYRGFRDLTKNK